ncbi:D-alanyl-D-alanine carboxypeptidase [Bartonella sp. W8098]|uniref:D-alanyl-D-alanine carboxypeptidase family protein n=1 Tax=Bartonella TaxID=773 RepID=UPI0018DC24FD|nr:MULTISPECIES: D-alanyl-D-alanine carboxypeptidase family protein [Bartonella]MBH9987076.1 D-alanyl-D-alanine carboxypeptidase [Bartonella apis]MBI0170874.1 D-alanyl-D-alanine carboxypeptidase [Bartonella sp. W8151]
MRKITGVTALFLLFFMSLAVARANPYLSVDVATGRILAHNDAFDRWYPASLTKMMTAYVTFRALHNGEVTPQTRVTVSAAAAKLPPSHSGYKPGSVLDLDTALSITLVKSTNDLATAIAETVGGSEQAFVVRMNEEAQRLGMFGTHFANANGLPNPDNYSTARDLAVLAVQIRREFPQYAHYFSIPAIDFGGGRKVEQNSNNLIGRFSGADGMKTGFICASGFNLVASATRNKRTIIAVVLGADRIDQREALAAKLLNDGFSNQGSSQTTLATLQPYGTKLTQVSDIRDRICNDDAWKARMQHRDEKGKVVFDSPYISARPLDVTPLQVRLISAPAPAKPGEIPAWKIPVPTPRPQTMDAQ